MFTVVWTNRALDRLADMYVALDLTGQDRLAAKFDALNHRLSRDPRQRASRGPVTTASLSSTT